MSHRRFVIVLVLLIATFSTTSAQRTRDMSLHGSLLVDRSSVRLAHRFPRLFAGLLIHRASC
jgi:hypothetical protein